MGLDRAVDDDREVGSQVRELAVFDVYGDVRERFPEARG